MRPQPLLLLVLSVGGCVALSDDDIDFRRKLDRDSGDSTGSGSDSDRDSDSDSSDSNDSIESGPPDDSQAPDSDSDSASPDDSGGVGERFCADDDGDGYGDPGACVEAQTAPDGYVADASDCDDLRAEVSPAGAEVCHDGLDNACDGDPSACTWRGDVAIDTLGPYYYGAESNDQVGHTLASAGDVQGDGVPDLLIGAPYTEVGGTAYLVPMEPGDLPSGAQGLFGSAALAFDGLGATGKAGWDLAGLGDLEGGGYGSFAVSARTYPYGSDLYGWVYVLSGPLADGGDLSVADAAVEGEAAGDQIGYALAPTGDLDGLGSRGLWIGAPEVENGADTAAGLVYRLDAPLTAAPDLDEAPCTLTGDDYGARLGVDLVGGTDLDGDGLADLVAASTGWEAGTGLGVFWFVPGGVCDGIMDISDVADGTRWGDSSHAASSYLRYGVRGAALPDATGDGLSDVLLSTNGADGDVAQSGEAYLVPGPFSGSAPLDDETAKLSGEVYQDYAGSSVAGADVNGDALTDLVVGAPGVGTGGAVYLVFAPLDGAMSLEDADATFNDGDMRGALGAEVANAGDVSQDGVDDLLFGAPSAIIEAAGGAQPGAAWLMLSD